MRALNPNSGTQHMRIVKDGSVAAGTSRTAFTPNIGSILPSTPSQVKLMVAISNDQGADYDVIGQAPAQSSVAWRVKFSYSDDSGAGPGTIYVLDNDGSGAAFVNTGVLWTPGVYRELKVQFDPAINEIRYDYNGSLIYSMNVVFATSVTQMVWFTDNDQLTPSETGDFDGLSWIDTPSDAVPTTQSTWGKIKGTYR